MMELSGDTPERVLWPVPLFFPELRFATIEIRLR